MKLNMLSYGELMLYTGLFLIATGIVLLIICNIISSAKKKSIKKELTDKYGF